MGYLKRNILFVDDDPSARALIKAMLKQAGYIPEVAKDGFEALEFVYKYAFDLILLDIMMPKMNGYEFLKRIKSTEKTRNIPVVMLSQMDDPKSVKRCTELGAEDYIIKPPDRKILMGKFERILGSRPRFAEVTLTDEDEDAFGQVTLPVKILSIGESGMVMRTPISLEHLKTYEFKAPVFKKIGVDHPKFKVILVQEDKEGFLIYFSFVGTSDQDVQAIRSWVIEQNLKRAG